MKIYLPFLCVAFIATACCWGTRKCLMSENGATFRLINAVTGEDLVFGSSRVYDKTQIKFYSLRGADTIMHQYIPGAYSNAVQDSFLFVYFGTTLPEIAYIKLNASDTDTVSLRYRIFDKDCCPDVSYLVPDKFNNKPIESANSGIYLLKK